MPQRKSEPKMARAICRTGMCFLAVLLLTATSFPAQAQDTPPNLTAWSDLDGAVANAYAGLSNDVVLYPPGPRHFSIDQGYFTFTDTGEVAALTNLCACSTQFNVTVWHMVVVETQTTTRVWLYEGAGGVSFYTNQSPSSYDPIQWVQNAYGQAPPGYLTGADLDQWYADRDRSRYDLTMTLVDLNDWPALQAAQQAAVTNAPANGSPPFPPVDTNQLAFAGFQMSGTNAIGLWIYTPGNRPVVVLTRSMLSFQKSGWTVMGKFSAVSPFKCWPIAKQGGTAFFMMGFADAASDSDGDGIPDVLETYVFGTNPYSADTDGDGVSDYDEIYIYGTDPCNPDTTAPAAFITSPPDNYQLTWVP